MKAYQSIDGDEGKSGPKFKTKSVNLPWFLVIVNVATILFFIFFYTLARMYMIVIMFYSSILHSDLSHSAGNSTAYAFAFSAYVGLGLVSVVVMISFSSEDGRYYFNVT